MHAMGESVLNPIFGFILRLFEIHKKTPSVRNVWRKTGTKIPMCGGENGFQGWRSRTKHNTQKGAPNVPQRPETQKT